MGLNFFQQCDFFGRLFWIPHVFTRIPDFFQIFRIFLHIFKACSNLIRYNPILILFLSLLSILWLTTLILEKYNEISEPYTVESFRLSKRRHMTPFDVIYRHMTSFDFDDAIWRNMTFWKIFFYFFFNQNNIFVWREF